MAQELVAFTPQEKGTLTIGDTPLGRGGEGSVYSVTAHGLAGLPEASTLVAKIYHDPLEGGRLPKIKAMVQNSPHDPSVAWPLAALATPQGVFQGYVMIKLAADSYRPWADLAHAKTRRETATSFDVRYGVTAIRNLAAALQAVHGAGHRVGDINESNIFVGADARVLLVDTDSAQISTPGGPTYPCLVGKPEYTAPELSHGPLKDQNRTPASDVYGFAVAAYQMLTGGAHPTDGAFDGDGEPPSTIEKIRLGIYPGLNPAGARGLTSPPRIPVDAIPGRLRGALLASLTLDPAQRAPLGRILPALDKLLADMKQCSNEPHHWYDPQDGPCGWCSHKAAGRPDPWATTSALQQVPTAQQITLNPVSFQQRQAATGARRAAPARAGSQAAHAHQAAGGQTALPQSQPPAPPAQAGHPSQGGYPPQGYYPYVAGNVAPPPTPEPDLPKKYKGKMILDYADGTRDVRPPLGALLRSNPKIAIYCFKEETPEVAKFWWPGARDLARPAALGLGLLLGLLMALGWVWGFQAQAFYKLSVGAVELVSWAGYLAGLGVTLTSLWLACSGLWDRRKLKKRKGSLDGYREEALWKTTLRFGGLGLCYGPLLVLGLVIGLGVLIFGLVANAARPIAGSN